MRKFSRLLFGLSFVLLLNSCSKETTLGEVSPDSVETISELKTWATKNDKLNQANLIEWNNSIPIMLPDSIKGYAAPVKTESSFKEYITFELGGKRHGWFKTYKRLNETDMEIVIQSIEGKTLKSGVLHKSKNVFSKGKTSSMREMNFEEGPITYDTIFNDFIFSAPRLYPPTDNYVYVGTYQFEFKAFYDPDSYIGGAGGIGSSSLNFDSYNYPEITNNLTNDCFNQVLNELINNNLKGKIANIIEQFNVTKKGSGYDFTIDNNLFEVPKTFTIDNIEYVSTLYGKTNGKNISLNTATLQNASRELIAKTIIHEILHVYLNDSDLQDHIKIASGYVGEMALFLEKSYGMNLLEAKSICASGLAKIPNYELILKVIDPSLTREKVVNTIYKFSNTSNTKQYGTYCN
jgi:hypothetical protein